MTTRKSISDPAQDSDPVPRRVSLFEVLAVLLAFLAALVLGFSNLGVPSIWHDEAVQIFVAKNLWETGRPLLPSGHLHPVAPVFNAVMALFMGMFGTGEIAVRTPAVLFSGINVLLTFLLVRRLLGPLPSVVAAWALALSPWSLAWAREARFYSSQQTWYLFMLLATWGLVNAQNRRTFVAWSCASIAAYLLGVGTSLHSVLFLGPLAGYSALMVVLDRKRRCYWLPIAGASCATGVATMVIYRLTLPAADIGAVFTNAGLGATSLLSGNVDVPYYFAWLWNNLGSGFLLLATLGFALMLVRKGRGGLFAALGFLAPVLALTFLVAYRRHRFMYFAYPMYVAAFSYAACELGRFVWHARRSGWRMAASVLILLFAARLGVSAVRLVGDTLDVACGAHTTLATRHPQWRGPCQYVRERIDSQTAVLTTTYVTTLYYVGRVDNWFPSGPLFYEAWETGVQGLATIDDLRAFMDKHPRGFFLAEWGRFFQHETQAPERAWVNEHMTLVEEASSPDVKVYRWETAAPTPG